MALSACLPGLFLLGSPARGQEASPIEVRPSEDRDGDRIPDGADECPAHAETDNAFDDHDGCPDERMQERLAEHRVSFTFGPGLLILPLFELTAEVKLHRHVSVAALGGVGSIFAEVGRENAVRVPILEAGGQVRGYYPSFESGFQLGAEITYLTLGEDGSVTGMFASGASAGPFGGYKWIAPVGFTVDLQGGVTFAEVPAMSSSGEKESTVGVQPILNGNVGWSF